ncbi:CBS domain-containing protein [Actinopolymorpha sp. B9G3]|uniref:CBS domain-containing protein n=1 Tax=Actinopolymorpha sp. B9G3 TaxID=3158970 RepID=UPI0032D8E1C0
MNHKPIIVGVDGSAASVGALRWAATEAERRDLQVEAVLATPIRDQGEGMPDPAVLLAAAVDVALPPTRRRLRERVSQWVVPGDPAEVLLERSRRAAFLVLGRTHGRDPLHTSTMARCMRHAACAVAILPTSVPEPGVPPAAAARSTAYGSVGDRLVGDVMRPHVLGIDAASGADAALQLMVGAGVHHAPVMESGQCVGLLYETDVVWHLAGWPVLDGPPSAAAVARKPPPRVAADQPVRQAAVEIAYSTGDAVLVTEQEKIVGILTSDDLVTLLAEQSDATQTDATQTATTQTDRRAMSAPERSPQERPGHHG